MTNWKDGASKHRGGKGKKKSEKAEKGEKATAEKTEKREKSPADKKWKKFEHVQRTVSDLKSRIDRVKAQNDKEKEKEKEAEKPDTGIEIEAPVMQPEMSPTETPEPETSTSEPKTDPEAKEIDPEPQPAKEEHGEAKATSDQATGEQTKKEEPQVEDEDPEILLRNKILETIKNGFSIARAEDGEIQISVDNVYPLLKALGLNPQNESVMDMVREACMESSGGIAPSHFDEVVLSLVKIQDEELWRERLAEKARGALKESSEKAKAEAERMKKLEQGMEEEEEEESWEEMERKKEAKAKEKEKERQMDELYDNLKMAFRFIDSDGDGVISVKDVYNLMMGLGEMLDDDELWGMVTMADIDCDGKLTFKDFKRFLLKGTPDEIGSEDEEGEGGRTEAGPTGEVEDPSQDEATVADTDDIKIDEPQTSDEKKGEGEPEPPKKFVVVEPQEDTSARAKRRQSLLYGYKIPSLNMAEKQADENAADKTVTKTGDNKVDETAEHMEKEGAPDGANTLNAITEEDEHSNYDINENTPAIIRNEQKASSAAEGKRKYFSRQGSSASLKNRPNSIIANSESTIEDSGFETLDTNIDCSEIREVPDVFDLSEDDSELQKLTSPRSKSKDIVDDDEDKIDDECVRESLSRFSNLSDSDFADSDDEAGDKSDKKIKENWRKDVFSTEFMYYEVERVPTDEEMSQKITEQMKADLRLTRAGLLQKAIVKRSNTVPALIRYVPKPPTTPNTNVNGIKCSHIDIDLRCQVPPKADIKSLRRFTERVNSARTRPKSAYFDEAFLERKMSIVDISQSLEQHALTSDGSLTWRSRPLTARSSRHLRHQTHAWDKENETPRPRRSRSAMPHINRREHSESPTPHERPKRRPQTANLTYSKPRRTVPDLNSAKLQKVGDFTVVTSEPFAMSDQLYPRKSLLTSYHHGFKTIWPIGRKINVLQSKRPFESFEMNSYSRAVERAEFPFRGDSRIDDRQNKPKPTPRATKTIKLELDTGHITKPKSKRLSSLLPCTFTPRTVR